MAQYNDVFKRKEIKFLLDNEQYTALYEKLLQIAAVDGYGLTDINNIYFDTDDFSLIRTSLDKPAYKEKLRLRSYGTPGEDTDVFIEIKKKYDGIVYKRRIAVPYRQAVRYLYDSEPLPENYRSQILREIDYLRACYGALEPAMRISYKRIAMAGLQDPGLRITFDSDIVWSTDSLLLTDSPAVRRILEPGQRLMELKIARAYPLEIARMLSELEIRPVSFSKYGRGYLQLASENGRYISHYSYADSVPAAQKKVRYA
ncbi:MAG: polyphosphate polymerase domain-containing protein [Lachnospiraceae bacterium]|nr:polyphosphate polymerase domain-containing protein [Lachnospiraceae bacterium]